jgi:hypothetical protein
MPKPKEYSVKRPLLETLDPYVEAAKVRQITQFLPSSEEIPEPNEKELRAIYETEGEILARSA